MTTGRYGRMLSLAHDRYMGSALARYGEYSESEVQLWRQLIQPHHVVADLGANIGAHTVALASLVPMGGVVAVEPLPFLYGILRGNLVLNGITNVAALEAAIGARTGTIRIPALDYTRDDNFGGYPLDDVKVGNDVPLVRLDDVMLQADFIKADVEGMELAVLEGAPRIIRECRPVLYLENNPGPQQQTLIDYVHGLGYDLWWHYAPHYNPENVNQAPPEDEHILRVVSYNMLGIPSEASSDIGGLTKIERRVAA